MPEGIRTRELPAAQTQREKHGSLTAVEMKKQIHTTPENTGIWGWVRHTGQRRKQGFKVTAKCQRCDDLKE